MMVGWFGGMDGWRMDGWMEDGWMEAPRKSDVVSVTITPILFQDRNSCLLFHEGESPPL
jgi:hypothetical protein